MKLTKTAWRNLWRRKRRTIITGVSVGFGVWLSATFTGMGDYMYTNMINTSASMGYGHVTVEALGFNQTPNLDKKIRAANTVREKVLRMPGVTDAMVRIMGQAMFASAAKSIGGAFIAIDPATESPEHNLLMRSIIQGKLFSGTGGRGIVIGSKMAEKLKLRLGKKLVYTATDANGEIVSEIARVSGIFKTGSPEIDGGMALLPIDSVRAALHYGPDDASLVAIMIDDQRRAAMIGDGVRAAVGSPDREILTWGETQRELAGLIRIDRSANYLSQFLVGLVIAAGILNTLLMSVLERSREFGIMMAVGMSPRTLFRLVVLESFWMAVIGLIIGVIITTPWYLYLANVGLDFSGMTGDDYTAAGVIFDPLVRVRLFKESVIAILAGVFSLTMLSGLYPAWRAGRIPPVESLRTI